ncbi:MAG: cupredoxin domain-containing protein [Chloroflexi bacterium]|nr:cupredoxin domain-containing protein [Chloroflexota bacterium]
MRQVLMMISLLASVLTACSSASADTMMKQVTPTSDAMMAQATATPDTMMKPMPTGDAMMSQTTPTTDAMMAKTSPTPDAMMMSTPTAEAMMTKLPDQLFAAHFVDSAPMHGQSFAVVPDKVLINFNFTLDESSSINVTKDNMPITLGKVMLGERKLSMSAILPKDAGDGLYVVKYKACWPDKSCHDGQFAFRVDSKMKGSYLDLTGKSQVTIRMKDIRFAPMTLAISQGTHVTWVNDDSVTHFINTDPHPTHNNLSALNSLEIKKGESYSFRFEQPGEWAYHCSAHVPAGMVGRIIVVSSAS